MTMSYDQDLSALEAEFGDRLALSPDDQDLLFRQARTANSFTDEPVTEEQLRAVYDLIKWAPTAMNSQPMRVTLVRSRDARERLVSHLMEGNQAKTLAAPLVAIVSADLDFHDNFDRIAPHATAAKDRFAADPAARRATATTSATLQAAYFLLGVRAAGLAAGPMGGYDADGIAREFFPADDQQVIMVVNIGNPAPDAYRPRGFRLPYDEVVTTL